MKKAVLFYLTAMTDQMPALIVIAAKVHPGYAAQKKSAEQVGK